MEASEDLMKTLVPLPEKYTSSGAHRWQHTILIILFFFFFIGPHLRHMKVPRLGVKSEL